MAGVCLDAALALLSGYGGGSSTEPVSVVTVTITPTASVASTAAGTPNSDVVGRKFDLG